MTFTAQDAVNETYRHLLSGQRDTVNLLAQPVDSTQPNFVFTGEMEGIQAGSLLSVGLEIVYVRTANAASKGADVIRGWLGSTTGAHVADAVVYVNPRFSGWDIFQALNVELNDLSSPAVGMFAVGEVEFNFSPQIRGYDLGVPRSQISGVLEVRYRTQDATKAWPRIRRYEVLWDQQTADFPSGTAIRLDEPAWPGQPIRVKYSRPFVPLTALTDDLIGTSLLPATAVDIPPLGAAAMLMFHKEAKRSFLEAQGDTRRAAEVPPGSSTRDAATLLGLRNRRASSEAARLSQNYPNYKPR